MSRKVVFFDIDGTLMDSKLGISKSAVVSIEELKKRGHIVCINTGRTRDLIQDEILKIGFHGIVAGCGSYIEFNEEILLEQYIPIKSLNKAIDVLEKLNICYSLEAKDSVFMTKEMAEYLSNNVQAMRGKQNSEMEKLLNEQEKIKYEDTIRDFNPETISINKINFICKDSYEVQKIIKYLGNDFNVISHESPFNSIVNGEIIMENFNKGTAVRALCNHLNIPIKDTIAFGDSMNDLDLLNTVYHGVAMGNSLKSLKDKVKFICESIHEDGIYEELKRLELI